MHISDSITRIRTLHTTICILGISLLLASCNQGPRIEYQYATVDIEPSAPSQKRIICYVRSDDTPVLAGPTGDTAILGAFNAFQPVEVIDDSRSRYLKMVNPVDGYLDFQRLFTEAEFMEYFQVESDWQTELDMVCHGMTPYQDILFDPDGLPAYSYERPWMDDGIARIKYIQSVNLDVFEKPSFKSTVVGQVEKNTRVIIDSQYKPQSDWVKVLYPFQGYANRLSLFSDEQILGRLEVQTIHVNKIRETLGLDLLPVPEILNKSTKSKEPVKVKKTIFRKSKDNSQTKTTAPTQTQGRAQTQTQVQAPKQAQNPALREDVNVVKIPDQYAGMTLEERAQALINSIDPNFVPPDLATPVHISNQKLSVEASLNKWNDKADLNRNMYAGIDSIIMMTYPDYDNKIRINAMGTFSPYYIPMEKEFTRLGIPYGAAVEVTKANWPVSFGVGYNSMRAQTHSMVYVMQTNDILIYGKYTPVKLFNDQFELFLTAGATAWNTQIMNTKYPEHDDYYSPESTRGFGYTGGVGAMFEFHKFLIGMQYQYFGTPLVVLGPDFNEPGTQEELSNFIPTTQYKLYSGSNQFQIIIGYRIN